MSTAVTADLTEPQPLHCYRHPERETWVRCGRCDQPICMSCAMQGRSACAARPAASRPGTPWRRCGRIKSPSVLVAGGLGAAVGYFGAQFGWFMIVVGFFAGTLIAEALDRTVGIKRGPRILAIAVAGILVGGLIGGAFSLAGLWREMQAFAASPEAEGMPAYPLDAFLMQYVPSVLIALVATIVGAWTRLRRF